MQTSDFVAYYFPLDAVANYWWKNLLLPLGLLYGWFVVFQTYHSYLSHFKSDLYPVKNKVGVPNYLPQASQQLKFNLE